MFRSITLIAAASLFFAPGASAIQTKEAPAQKAAALKAGDPAPALAVEKWVKGEPVAAFEKGKIYVVEFWATWCGPCIANMPHLTSLQEDYKDRGVTFIGTNIWEDVHGKPPYSADTLALIEKFVANQNGRMGYTVAYDGGSKQMADSYMKAAGRNGIPSAFIVDQQGVIAWIGHPAEIDFALAEIAAGKWDVAQGPAREKAVLDELASIRKKLKSDPAGALAAFDVFEKAQPVVARHQDDLRVAVLEANGQWDKAYAFLGKQVEIATARKDAMRLNEIAWGIVDPAAKLEKRDVELALKAATSANELTGDKDPAIMDTLARAYFTKGDAKKAVEIETKAVGLAGDDPQLKQELQKALDEFKAKNAQ